MSSSGFLPVTSKTSSAVRLMMVAAGRSSRRSARSPEATLARLHALHVVLDVLVGPDVLEMRMTACSLKRPVGAAALRRWRVERCVRYGAHGGGGAVLLVVGVEDEEDVERP